MKQIPNKPGYYVDEIGRVFSRRRSGKGSNKLGTPRQLKVGLRGGEDGKTYEGFTARINGRSVNVSVHRAVCETYHGPLPFEGAVVRHLDGNPRNNRPENLAWGSQKQNVADAARHRAEETDARLHVALEYGLDIKGRRVFLHGDIDGDIIGKTIRGLYLLNDLSPEQPIELYVSSYGGELDEAFALHDVTRTIEAPVHTVALGKCMSAAPLLVACGQKGKRWASENCQFMMHDCALEIDEGSPTFITAYIEAARAQMARYAELLAKYTDKPKSHWKRFFQMRSDKFFSAEDAMEWGLIDQIWSEKDVD
jgi:ATP-dependent Clp protease protease subunit